MFPHCHWNPTQYEELMVNRDTPEGLAALDNFTVNHAMMCLASEYAEELHGATDTPPQKEAFHCDYLDAELKRKNTGLFDYFGLARVRQLRE